jgi:hypothetical protein
MIGALPFLVRTQFLVFLGMISLHSTTRPSRVRLRFSQEFDEESSKYNTKKTAMYTIMRIIEQRDSCALPYFQFLFQTFSRLVELNVWMYHCVYVYECAYFISPLVLVHFVCVCFFFFFFFALFVFLNEVMLED